MQRVIRNATRSDAAECATIYAPYVTDTWTSFELIPPTSEEMADRIEAYGESHAWLVAELDGLVMGYAYGSPHRSREAYASSCDVAVYCAPECQGKGLGKALYSALFPILSEKYHAAFAGIALPNEASTRLHARVGFQRIGVYREVGHKLGSWRDVEWWQRLL